MTKSPQFILVLLLSGLIAVLGGCASGDVTHRQKLAAQEQIARPDRIIVYDFGTTPADIPASAAITGNYEQRATPQTGQEIEVGRQLGTQVARKLADNIRKMGITAVHAGKRVAPDTGDIVITGQFITIEEGSRGKRVVIGFGSGSAELGVHVEGYLIEATGPRLLGSRQVETSGGKMPGVAVPILARSPAALAINSALKTKGERGAENIEGAAELVADEVAEELETEFRRRGWI